LFVADLWMPVKPISRGWCNRQGEQPRMRFVPAVEQSSAILDRQTIGK
jgi:hypothetical protein